MNFNELSLSDEIKAGLKDVSFKEPTPVQAQAIPLVLEGKDLIATAQTGTGKTGAFVIPIISRITNGDRNGTKALILTPTRELAQQIDEQIFAIGYHSGISSATVIGGSDFSQQAKAIKAGVDIIVATPGRLMDQKKVVDIDFSRLEYLVLDEADRMLDMGFLPDIKKIIGWLPDKRQTLLFSATMPAEIERLASGIMKDPVSVEIARAKAPTQVEQRAYLVKSEQKIPLVKKIFATIEWDSCIIFTSTKKGTDELQRLLKKEGIKAASIHGDRSQDERTKSLKAFKSGEYPVIVATNVIARGIDIDDVSLIINYDVPNNADDYIHRIGRTARYDKSGIAVTLITRRDGRLFQDIDRIKGNRINKIEMPESFDEKTKFYWDKEEEKASNGKKTVEKSKEPEPAASNKSREQKAKQPRPDKNRNTKKKTEKKQSGSGGGKKSASGQGQPPKQAGGNDKKSTNRDNKKDERKSPKPVSARESKDREPVEEPVRITPVVIEKARERNRNTRKPAKGVWGIFKSFIPKFIRE